MVEILDEKSLEDLLKAKEIVILDYYSDWCGPCKSLAPHFAEFSIKYPSIKTAKVNLTKNYELGLKYKVMNVPCLVVLQNGQEIERMTGFKGRDILETLFIKHS